MTDSWSDISKDAAAGRSSGRTAVIIGAGPAGLTAALELLRHSDVTPLVLEESDMVGGISRTVVHEGNRMDIGGHRFFSKSDWVMDWWRGILSIATGPEQDGEEAVRITYHNRSREVPVGEGPAPEAEKVMLVRRRLSRIYYLRRFFDYPVKLNLNTVRNLGVVRMARIGASYAFARAFPRRPERSLEDFLINRFGRALYETFFKDYTEKVWGVRCADISAEWGAQRIKGLDVSKAVLHALRQAFRGAKGAADQKKVQTSLIERFLYPKYGPGQLWEEVARRVEEGGGRVLFGHKVTGLELEGERVVRVRARRPDGGEETLPADWVISSMPVKDLVAGISPAPPPEVAEIATALPYRDFLTVGLLLRRMRGGDGANGMPPDNWIYVQERDVRVGRLQVFNNWSPGMVRDPGTIWIGLEYFCTEGDDLWTMADDALADFAARELEQIGLADHRDVLTAKVVRMPKAYPAYFGAYARFETVRAYLDGIANLFPIGRNGMHKYNNQDHSMLTAKIAVEKIVAGDTDKAALWAVNVDDSYHEEKQEPATAATAAPAERTPAPTE